MEGFAERRFKLSERGTDVRTEVFAGVTTFMTMAYIIFLNPGLMTNAGLPFGPVMVATCIASAIGCLLMAFLANYPIALAPGMGLNAFFAFSVVIGMGISWQSALTAIFVEGLIFIALSLTRVRESVVNVIPQSLKFGISAGIGLFIAFIGFQNGGITVDNAATLVSGGTMRNSLPALLTLFGVVVIAALETRKVRGAILWGIIIVTAAAIPLGEARMPEAVVSMPPSIADIAFKLDFSVIVTANFWVVVFTFFFVDFFDTIGTLIGVASRAGLLDKGGHLPNARGALMADAIATTAGAALGVTTVTSYIESASGVSAGGRTGLTSVVTAGLFLLAIFFSPIIGIVPACATAPALIIVGVHMLLGVRNIHYDDMTELVPAALATFTMPFTYSIATGIEAGIVSYAAIKLLSGRVKGVSPVLWALAVIFIAKEALM